MAYRPTETLTRAHLLKDGKRISEAIYSSTAQNGYVIGIILKPEHTWSIEYVEIPNPNYEPEERPKSGMPKPPRDQATQDKMIKRACEFLAAGRITQEAYDHYLALYERGEL